MRGLRYHLHEWRMQRKIARILRYHRAHPEQCLNLALLNTREQASGEVAEADIRAWIAQLVKQETT